TGVGVVLLPAAEQQFALEQTEMVEEHHAVEMVDLVLYRTRGVALELPPIRLAVPVQGLQYQPLGADYLARDIGQRKASFFAPNPALKRRQHGIDHDEPVIVDTDDGHP